MVSGFLTSSSTHAYDESVLIIESPVTAHANDSAITALEGDKETVRRIDRHLQHAALLSGGEPYALHSWHTGINRGHFLKAIRLLIWNTGVLLRMVLPDTPKSMRQDSILAVFPFL